MENEKVIVAVDDSGIVLKKLEVMLQKKYTFHGFSIGNRALSYMASNPVDIIILDVDMPDINGFEMLKKIKEKDKLKNIPVIFLTSNADKGSVVHSAQAGVDEYIVKPPEEKIVLEKIEKLLSKVE